MSYFHKLRRRRFGTSFCFLFMMRPKDRGGLGFKPSSAPSQAWRLLRCHTNTLILRVCADSKCYPNGSTVGHGFHWERLVDVAYHRDSSTWHTIEYGLELLNTKTIWRVGNEANIWAWRDRWIPRDLHRDLSPLEAGAASAGWSISSSKELRGIWLG